MNIQREIKSYMAREGFSMRELVERLAITHKWSKSLSNFSGKLQRESLRYKEAEEVADVLGYDIVWKKSVNCKSKCNPFDYYTFHCN